MKEMRWYASSVGCNVSATEGELYEIEIAFDRRQPPQQWPRLVVQVLVDDAGDGPSDARVLADRVVEILNAAGLRIVEGGQGPAESAEAARCREVGGVA